MNKLLIAIVTVLALGAFAGPTFADQGGVPNEKSDGAKSADNAHGANGKNAGNHSAGDNGTDTDPQSDKGNDS